MQKFSTIGLIGRPGNPEVADSLAQLMAVLSTYQGLDLLLDDACAPLLAAGLQARVCPREDMRHCDLVIVVGGDGSMLKVAAMLADWGIPVVGVNRGRLGFLTDIRPEAIEYKIAQVLAGEYKVEPRFLLDASVMDAQGNQRLIGSALNDVVLHPGVAAQMIEFELAIDGELVYNQVSDGLIVATPTGSTAYSMSAGGPIMHPKLDALVLVPMYPHSLSSRPIVIDAGSEISIVVGDRHSIMPQVSCDGSVEHTAQAGDRITIRKKARQLKLLHPANYNYYETCRSKLGWSHQPGKV